MDVPNLLAGGPGTLTSQDAKGTMPSGPQCQPQQGVPTTDSGMPHGNDLAQEGIHPSTETSPPQGSLSPIKPEARLVRFEMLLSEPHHRAKARLSMRVGIHPHDSTDSIISTVKSFYGLYDRCGVVFEDSQGNTLIARFENFTHNMVVYVRVTPEEPDLYSQMLPPALNNQQTVRATSRSARGQSNSPQPGRGRRSTSATVNPKSRPKPAPKSRGSSSHGSFADGADGNVYSDSDGGNGSVSSSRRGRREQVASAEISLDNIVEGGRRKRAKFDSSELPLFVPPQIPTTASLSSVSPQRRVSSNTGASPFSYNNQQTFTYPHPLHSPQSYGQGDTMFTQGLPTPYSASTAQANGHSRNRGSVQYPSYRQDGSGALILPTPDHTVGSVISDEDVARQLMRLGDASNISNCRTSTSTFDDALSGKAEAASSSDESDDGEDVDRDLPPLPYAAANAASRDDDAVRDFENVYTSGDEYEDQKDQSFKAESDEAGSDGRNGARILPASAKARSSVPKVTKITTKARASSKSKSRNGANSKAPISSTSLPQPRKTSSASLGQIHPLAADEEDLSSKPRCQRCRKSKKGCDRQRPCQRCKDAGIGIEGCISEDENNGRKGRYGRHMGVPVKKTTTDLLPAPDHGAPPAAVANGIVTQGSADKSRKRKR